MESNWKEQSLEELEHTASEEPDFADNLAQKIHALRMAPLSRFTVEDVRLMIHHGLSLPFTVPLAIDLLSRNLFAEGDYYPGDLLQSVLNIEPSFWYQNRPLWQSLHRLLLNREWELEERHISADLFMELS
ncbi:hypothetical protein GCM10023189_52100 [Nibrella saemangeumensis]|uniref:Uncharacterized protein n=1 Tax=Nibrella saemangeumensis TaxID=1084526 RepID=A0ABP8NLJ8_9BACT